MRLLHWASNSTAQHCLLRTHSHQHFLIRPCPVHRGAPSTRNQPKDRLDKSCRRIRGRDKSEVARCALLAQQPTGASSSQAVELVYNLRQELDGMKRMQLSSACSLSVYRLTVLCTTERKEEVVMALAQVFGVVLQSHIPFTHVPFVHTACC